MKPNDNRVDLILESKNPTLGEQFKPVDLGTTTPIEQQWLNAFTRSIMVRSDLFNALTDILIWVNMTGIVVTLVPVFPWLIIPLIIMSIMLALVIMNVPGLTRVIGYVRLGLLVATTLMVLF